MKLDCPEWVEVRDWDFEFGCQFVDEWLDFVISSAEVQRCCRRRRGGACAARRAASCG